MWDLDNFDCWFEEVSWCGTTPAWESYVSSCVDTTTCVTGLLSTSEEGKGEVVPQSIILPTDGEGLREHRALL